MTAKTFKKKLDKILEGTEEFVTDVIDMTKMRKDAKKAGFDEITYVAGDSHNKVFLIHIQKI